MHYLQGLAAVVSRGVVRFLARKIIRRNVKGRTLNPGKMTPATGAETLRGRH